MPKNRDYTGLLRTPASMAWLIRERASLKGALDRRRKQLEELPREIVELEQRLAALDKVFQLHEVKVQPQVIRGTRPQAKALLPYGVLTKGILSCLREAAGDERRQLTA